MKEPEVSTFAFCSLAPHDLQYSLAKGKRAERQSIFFSPKFTCFASVFFLSLILIVFLCPSPHIFPPFPLLFPPLVQWSGWHGCWWLLFGVFTRCVDLVSSAIQDLQRTRIKKKNFERCAKVHKAACWWSSILGRGFPILCSDGHWLSATPHERRSLSALLSQRAFCIPSCMREQNL